MTSPAPCVGNRDQRAWIAQRGWDSLLKMEMDPESRLTFARDVLRKQAERIRIQQEGGNCVCGNISWYFIECSRDFSDI